MQNVEVVRVKIFGKDYILERLYFGDNNDKSRKQKDVL